ncbi:MAG: HAD family phosphatase [Pseudomonadota bacterium]
MNIVFDIGNVLVAWDPRAAFRDAFDNDTEIDCFLADVGFFEWNLEQDRGRRRAEAVAAIAGDWPAQAALLDGFFDRFHLTIQHKIAGTWAIMERLRARGFRIFGLTNWGPDTWPVALEMHPQLGEAFEDVVVSGHEGLIPQREIFELLCRRNLLSPSDCFFVDDSKKNADGARAAGWQAHHFVGPGGLRQDLTERGLL